jgi:hypothetical protein
MTAVARNATAVPAVCDAEGLASFRASLSSCDENESGSAMTALEECVAVRAAGSCDAGLSDPCAAQVSRCSLDNTLCDSAIAPTFPRINDCSRLLV